MAGYEPPDWYVAIQAAKYAGTPAPEALGVPYGPIVEGWVLTAMAAEGEAREALAAKARKQAGRG